MKVVDASLAVKWFLDEPGRDAAMQIIRSGEFLVAPDLIVIEVMNVLRRKQRQGLITEQQLLRAAETLKGCFGQLMPALSLVEGAVRLSIELDHSVYDCA